MGRGIDIVGLQAMTLVRAPAESLPVPPELSELVREHPEDLGLPAGMSKRQALGELLMKGARAAVFETREREREDFYARLEQDEESREAAEEAYAEARADGLI